MVTFILAMLMVGAFIIYSISKDTDIDDDDDGMSGGMMIPSHNCI